MKDPTSIIAMDIPNDPTISPIDHVMRYGAQRMLQAAAECEVAAYIDRSSMLRDDLGRQAIVRNGTLPEREILTPAGPITMKQPRVRDRRAAGERETFTSAIIPPYARRSPTINALLPTLYLKGISTGDFSEALAAVLGVNAAGLSASTITHT